MPLARSAAESARRLVTLKKTAARDFHSRQKAERRQARKASRSRIRWLRTILWWLGLTLLPFALLVRVSVLSYATLGTPTWLALCLGALVALAIFAAYGARISVRLTGKARVKLIATHVALPLVIAYCGYALVYLSSANAKTETVRSFYRDLHPLFRLALSTAVLLDGDLVVTDLRRTPADYAALGLPVYEASLHFDQSDGYVHAADLRTLGRPAWRNAVTRLYFETMGFRTLRHVGTADHLHVSLPSRE